MGIQDFIQVPLGKLEVDLGQFDCGREEVNDFFKCEAQAYQNELFGKTYFLCDPQSASEGRGPLKAAAGFTVANACIFTSQLPNSRQKKIGHEVHNEKGLVNYPAVLLAQLGIDNNYKGHQLGRQIIDYVAYWFTRDDNKSGCRHLILDAYNEEGLIQYYRNSGMEMFFSTEEQERKYRNWPENKGPLKTRLMFRDMILLKRPSIRIQ